MQGKKRKLTPEDTKLKILKAAVKLFLLQGFAGTSMSMIADLADVNQSLISHHFNNKQSLWLAVKEFIVADVSDGSINQTPESLEKFLNEIISFRLELYAKNPDFKRLVAWQRLENILDPKMSQKSGEGKLATEYWVNPIKYLQQHGKIKKTYPAELVFIWILKGMNGIIDDDLHIFKKNPHYRKIYIDMMISGLMKALT